MAGGPIGVIFLCIAVNMFRIYRYVKRRTLTRTRRRQSLASVTQQEKRLQQVATQSYLCVAVFCLTFVFGFVGQSLEAGAGDEVWDESSIFPWIVLQQIFYPLQGFWNFFIYCLPRYASTRQDFPGHSFCWTFCQALKRDAEDAPVLRRRSSDDLDVVSNHQKGAGALSALRSGNASLPLPKKPSPEQSKVSIPSDKNDPLPGDDDIIPNIPPSELPKVQNASADHKNDEPAIASSNVLSASEDDKNRTDHGEDDENDDDVG